MVLAVLSAVPASAQSTAGLTGTVRDPNGAVIANATLKLTNNATGASRSTESSSLGAYSFPQISPGTYELSVTAQGFKSTVYRNIELQVSVQGIVNVNLELASVNELVQVVEQAPLLNTSDASTGTPFGTQQVLQLPLEGRNVAGLLSLQTGVTYLGTDVSDARNGSVNGGRSDQGNVTLDGVDVNDQDTRPAFTSALRMPLDSVEEFRVTTVGANADQGRTSGAQISLVTKHGTNSFHGSLYEFNRNTAFTANSFFNNAAGVPRPQLVRNVFGGSVGGPVIKNRVFAFFNYEGRRDASATNVTATVPTQDLRNGYLDYVNNNGGVSQLSPDDIKALDPLGIGVSPAVLELFNQYPEPNDSTRGDGLAATGYRFSAKAPLSWNTYVTRLDWHVDQAGYHTLFLRGNLQNDRQTGTPQLPGQPASGSTQTNAKGLAVGYTHVLSPRLVGTFHYGLTRISTGTSGAAESPVVNPFDYFLTPALSNVTGRSTVTPVHTIAEDMTWTRGSHSLQFGGTARLIRRRISSQQPFPYAGGQAYQLSGGQLAFTPADAPIGSASAPNGIMALLGILAAGNATYNYTVQGDLIPQQDAKLRDFGSSEYELYLQDSWRLRPNLTLTAGLRWSLMPPPSELNGQQTTNVPSYGTLFRRRLADAEQGLPDANELVSFVARDSAQGTALYPTFKRNFAPRISLAYSPDHDKGWLSHLTGGPGKTSIRLGAGMFYDLFGSGMIDQLDANSFGLTTTQITPIGTFDANTAPRFTSLTAVPSNLIPPSPGGGPGTPPIGLVTGTQVIDYGIKPPYVFNLNLSVSRQLGNSFGIDVGYVGRLSRRQLIMSQGASQPLNFRDPQSGTRLYDAMAALDSAARQQVAVADMQPIPFWENLYSNAAGGGLTATQVVYSQFAQTPTDPVTSLVQVDSACNPACSNLGAYTFMQPQFWGLLGLQSIGSASYNSMQVTLRKQLSNGYQFTINYTYSKSLDLYSQTETRQGYGFPSTVLNALDPGAQRAVSDFDMTHQINANWVAELPFGKGKHFLNRGGIADAVLGGWQLSGLFRITSGLPFSPMNGYHYPTNWCCEVAATQVAPVKTQNVKHSTTGGPNMFADPAAAVQAFDFTRTGQVGSRNVLRGDGIFSIDMGLGKRFALPFEGQSLQFRAEAFNVTNTARFTINTEQNMFIDNPTQFGTYDSLLGAPRVLQVGLRYEF
ncbi:MAG: carboxypeptidase regulatory-like domain-containing protein [Acidobacteria bacterium]|nr:carboxypeptidase regulatory-like domain-containing protein [Acidobacteriota bacterium]